MSNTPFMQLYVADYMADTRHLSTEEHGAYLLLLMTMWKAGGSLPNDARKLARIAGVHPPKWARIWDNLAEFFDVDGDQITQGRLVKEYEKACLKSRSRAVAGSKGGKAKALKNNDVGLANATAKLKHSSEPEPYRVEEAKASLSPDGDALATIPFDEIAVAFSAYNVAAEANGWGKAQVLNKTRRASLRQRLREAGGLDGWQSALDRAAASDFVSGRTPEAFRCDLDFLLQQKSFTRLMEGKYDNRSKRPTAGPSLSDDPFMRAAQRRMAGGPG